MSMKETLSPAAVFAVVFVVIVGAAAVASLADGGVESPPEVENSQFDPEEVLEDEEEDTDEAEITVDEFRTSTTIILDTGEGVTSRDVSSLTGALTDDGHDVRPPVERTELESDLDDAVAYVAINPGVYTEEEAEAVEEFADDGGRVLVATDAGAPGLFGDVDGGSVEGGAGNLASATGVYSDPGFLYDVVENEDNYLGVIGEPVAGSDADAQLMGGVERVVMRGAVAVDSHTGSSVLRTPNTTQVSTTRREGAYSVVEQDGNVLIAGDSSFLQPENSNTADNPEFIGNIADFLLGDGEDEVGDETPDGNGEGGPEDPEEEMNETSVSSE